MGLKEDSFKNHEEIPVDSWEEFQHKLRELQKECSERKKKTHLYESDFLYRGEGNSSWELFTTLERYTYKCFTFSEYYQTISKIKSQIESFTGSHWDIRNIDEYKKWAKQNNTEMLYFDQTSQKEFVDEYRYMAYLRHHGFPSPLLDWTSSPYVAAYFAFAGIPNIYSDQRPKRVSVYVYQQYQRGRRSCTDNPFIHVMSPYIQMHRRHFLQQSQYTICISYSGSLGGWRYEWHENAFFREKDRVVWKFTIPSSEYRKVLHQLEAYNLNAYSLYGSEESLMETLALRALNLSENRT